MTEDRLREAISDAEDNLRRTREFAQVLVDAVERLKLGKRKHHRVPPPIAWGYRAIEQRRTQW